jgi:hypothetical protein
MFQVVPANQLARRHCKLRSTTGYETGFGDGIIRYLGSFDFPFFQVVDLKSLTGLYVLDTGNNSSLLLQT